MPRQVQMEVVIDVNGIETQNRKSSLLIRLKMIS
jgi:hypothetical protein